MPFAKQLSISDIPTDKPIFLFDIDGVFNAFMNEKDDNYFWVFAPHIDDDAPRFEIDRTGEASLWRQNIDRNHPFACEGTFTIQWSNELAQTLLNYKQTNDVNFIWLTSWDDNGDNFANDTIWPNIESPMLGFLPTWIRRDTHDSKVGQVVELRTHLLQLLNNGEIDKVPPIVHFDDTYVNDPRSNREHLRDIDGNKLDITMSKSPYLFINTNPRYGITPKQWETAVEFVKKHS